MDPDPVNAPDAERQVEEAKQSMFARMEELGRRLQDARQKVDIKAHIAAHPQLAVGIAFGLGALLALPGSGGGKKRNRHVADNAEVKSGLIGAAMATIGSLVFSLLKDVAMRQAGGAAFDWWQNREGAVGATEAQASRTRETEAFFNR